MCRFAAGLAALLVLAAATTAGAQEWLRDRRSGEGPGIHVGEGLVLHLGVGLEGGFDSNALYAPENPDRAMRLRVAPYLDLGTRTLPTSTLEGGGAPSTAPQKVQFRLGFAAYYDHHFPIGDANESAVNQINGLNAVGIDTNMQLVLFPAGKVGFVADVAYLRTQQAYDSGNDAGHSRHDISPGLGIRIRPGGGALTIETGYRLHLLLFEDPELATENNRHAHDIRVHTTWKMFPKTALVSRVNFMPTFYMFGNSDKENSLPVRSVIGLQGLLANKFGLLLLVGYGVSNYERGPNFESVIAQAELMFFITQVSTIRLGGERDFVDSYYANYYTKTGGYVSYSQLFGGVFLASIKGDVSGRQYATYSLPSAEGAAVPNSADRVDVWVGLGLSLEYRVTEWLSILGSLNYSADVSDFGFTITTENPETGQNDAVFQESSFQKFEAFLGVKGHY